MSNIPLARSRLADILVRFGSDDITPKARREIKKIIPLLHREKFIRRAKAHRTRITKAMRNEVHRLARTTNLTYHQIATRVGLGNTGRVSEVLHGKR